MNNIILYSMLRMCECKSSSRQAKNVLQSVWITHLNDNYTEQEIANINQTTLFLSSHRKSQVFIDFLLEI